ncbi:MAG: Gfo/Idh/MocA family oxidoreductase [Mesorhizobium sp.]|uniref:Gfo/Idh/MocA family protein n=1 Tax=Mesorhizobium sp. TaxID=1871066 RepID=UPI000FE589D8|nr:Gfo/Idh/MocA family oxidoreductase [Mesorhizobium sp.]RWL17938.1 MAG: Gfo/Idh/MocA family oxidoreductase [Mesorhizobium sp.]
MDNETIRRFGRRVRLGMVGGGEGSIIGETHMLALRADGLCELVAGALSSRPEVARASAARQMIAPDRSYDSYAEMAEREAARSDRIDAVVIATPPDSHLDIARHFLSRGFDVICEKPMTRDALEALELSQLVHDSARLFCLTHCYTGYPMVRQARDMVQAGVIGKARMIEVEFAPGEPGTAIEPENPDERHWRFREGSMGKAAILGEVGSHAYNIACFIGGSRAEAVSATLATFADRREVYDNAYVTVRYQDGAQGRLWSSYVASGNDMGLKFRIFGDKAGLGWDQESPETLVHKPIGEPAVVLARGYGSTSQASRAVTRFRAGFPEGYGLAFANLYTDFAKALIARELGIPNEQYLRELPSVDDGLEGMRLIEAAIASHGSGGDWARLSNR